MGAEQKHGNAKDVIVTSGFDEDALTLLKSGGSLTNFRNLTTTGDLANGIYAGADRVTITNLGDIETSGLGAVAVLVQGDDARVTNGGAIVTRGDLYNAEGEELFSEGIFVEGDRFSIKNFGAIETEGLAASALVGVGQGGEIVNFGEVISHSEFAFAIGAIGDGSTVTNRGQVTVAADRETGLFVAGDQFSIQNFGVVQTEGVAATALEGSGNGGEIVNYGDVIADSEGGFAIRASGDATKVINRGDVTISGDQGIGLFADGLGSQLINRGHIAVNADGAVGILAFGDGMEIVNSGHIEVNAAAWGLLAAGFGAQGSMQVSNSGRIEAHGDFAVGMEVQDATVVSSGHIAASGGAVAAAIDAGATFENTRSGVVLSEDAASVAVLIGGGQLENSGLIRGSVAVVGSFGSDIAINRGRIEGDVALGSGSDTFVFGARGAVKGGVALGDGPDRAIVENGAGVARFADFSPGHTAPDFVDVSAFYSGFSDLLIHAAQVGDDVVIKLDRDDKLVLENVRLEDLEASNFVFAGDIFAGELNGLPTVSIEVLADYLVQNHVSDEVLGPRRWEGSAVTVNIEELNESERAIVRRALDVWDDVVDLDFEFVSGLADLTFHADEFLNGTLVDWDGQFIRSAEITVARFISPLDPLSTPETYLHEIGHALGLGHAGPYNAIWENHQLWSNDTVQWTVMAGGRQNALGHAGSSIEVETPAMADILAMGTLYGFKPNHEGDTVYGFGNNTGQAAFDFSQTETASFTIYDTGGIDTLDASQYADNQVISLVAGTWSSTGPWVDNVGIYLTSVIENATGGSGDDTITGNAAGNRIDGGAGNDTLIGGAADDVLVFAPGFGADRILDFDADPANGQDRIDIAALNIASFASEVVITDRGADTLVSIGAGSILLVGVSGVGANAITQSDFLL